MIKNILVPERLGNYYLFPKRVVGFDIDKTRVTATQIYLSGKNVTIERCIDEGLEAGSELTHDEKVVNAIKKIVNSLDKFDEVYVSLSSAHVIFKSLRLPFDSYNKIKGVINFEVEPLLPFSASEALIDFIITKKIPQDKSSEVMVAAAQRKTVDDHVRLFQEAGVMPSKVVVDLLSLYALYKNIPAYKNLKGGVVLVDIGFDLTRLSYIYNGRIAFVRTLPKGIFNKAKDFAKIYAIPQNEAAEKIMRYGYKKEDDHKYKNAIEKVAVNFWSDIKFTIQSFSSQLQEDVEISKVLVLGQGAKIAGITDFASNYLSVDCQLFRTESLIDKPNVYIKNGLTIASSNIISLAIVFPSEITDKFNLYKVGEGIRDSQLVNKQLIAAAIFVLIILSVLFVNSYLQVGKLKNEAGKSEKEVILQLKKKKFKFSEDGESLADFVGSAESHVKKLEEQFSFVGKDRFSYLRYLLALQDAIDKEKTGIKIESITISPADNSITLKAEVRGYDDLVRLRADLMAQKKLFSHVSTPQEQKFEMKIDLAKKV
ncbi:pilus assembly protein PilM [Candidatus Dependentiae bacterium]